MMSCWPCTKCLMPSASNIPFKPNWSNCGISLACPTRRHRRSWEFRCPPLIIIGISLAPGCSSKSEANKFILLAEGLEFSPRILVYLYVDVHPDMESRPKQVRAQTGRFGLMNPRRGKDLDGFFTLHRRKGCLYAMSGHPILSAYRSHCTCQVKFLVKLE